MNFAKTRKPAIRAATALSANSRQGLARPPLRTFSTIYLHLNRTSPNQPADKCGSSAFAPKGKTSPPRLYFPQLHLKHLANKHALRVFAPAPSGQPTPATPKKAVPKNNTPPKSRAYKIAPTQRPQQKPRPAPSDKQHAAPTKIAPTHRPDKTSPCPFTQVRRAPARHSFPSLKNTKKRAAETIPAALHKKRLCAQIDLAQKNAKEKNPTGLKRKTPDKLFRQNAFQILQTVLCIFQSFFLFVNFSLAFGGLSLAFSSGCLGLSLAFSFGGLDLSLRLGFFCL